MLYFFRSFCLAIVLLSFSACTGNKKLEKVRIGLNSWPGYEFLYLAHVKGFFKEQGIETQIIEFNSLGDARRAFERGQVDVLGTTVVELLLSRYQSSKSAQAFFVTDFSAGADVVIGQSGINSMKDLKGKKVGVEIGTVTLAILSRALESHQMELSDVELVKVDPETMTSLFAEKKVSAITTYPPFSISILKSKGAKKLFSTQEIPGEIVDILMADKEYIQKNKNAIVAIVNGFEKARLYAQSDGSDGMEIMAKRERITKADFEDTFRQGVTVVPREDQARLYFGNEKFQSLVEQTDLILRKANMVSGEKRTQEAGINWERLN